MEQVVELLMVLAPWPILPTNVAVVDVTTDAALAITNGEVFINLSGKISNVQEATNLIISFVVNNTRVTASQVEVSIDGTQMTITILPSGPIPPVTPVSPPTVSPAQVPVTNLTGTTPYLRNVLLAPGTCSNYTFVAGTNIENVYVYVGIQTPASQLAGFNGGIYVYIIYNSLNNPNLCISPFINDNNEYTFSWDDTTWLGQSASKPKYTCQNTFDLQGTWFASVCNAGGGNLQFSLQVTLIEVPNTPQEYDTPSSVNILAISDLFLLVVGIMLYWSIN